MAMKKGYRESLEKLTRFPLKELPDAVEQLERSGHPLNVEDCQHCLALIPETKPAVRAVFVVALEKARAGE